VTLIDALKRDEGFRANPYLCSLGALTIGYGRNLEANPLTGAEWRALWDNGDIAVSLSEEGAQKLLKAGIGAVELQCATTFKWWGRLDRPRQEVLTNMAFNMGLPRLLGFRNMLAAIAAGDFAIAAEELLDSRYAKQTGQRAQRLAEQLRTGVRQ
jgi:lysozyme